ncbi:unnamed protein product [Darwinula stevensoni]|uniref:Uncharacterized protein n=1 Tax=Darwinula stevensoni TaxID=69355 RepID=A0A7R8X7A7_9CRUS|nr:unnamed protein product [Darwinula stevensoni]CAG0888899.1 unnamed protein product [Darwinula stevensoni]
MIPKPPPPLGTKEDESKPGKKLTGQCPSRKGESKGSENSWKTRRSGTLALSDAFADASVLFLGTTRKLRNATEGMFQFAGLSNQTAGALLESTLRATSNTTTEVAFTIGEFLGKPRVRGLISSLAAGAAVTSFHWIVLYWDSDIPGRNPPAPVSPAKSWRKNELQKGGGTGLHLSYMVGLAHGILTS